MPEPQRKPGVAFWATVVVVVALAAYPLSTGPAAWLRVHVLPKSTRKIMDAFYNPMAVITHKVPGTYFLLADYLSLWVDLETFEQIALFQRAKPPVPNPDDTPESLTPLRVRVFGIHSDSPWQYPDEMATLPTIILSLRGRARLLAAILLLLATVPAGSLGRAQTPPKTSGLDEH